jgi:hypothetical protein
VTEVSEDDVLAKARAAQVVYLVKIRSLRLLMRLKAQGSKVVFDLTEPLWELRYRRGGWWNVDDILLHADADVSR